MHLIHLTIDCSDPLLVASFWAAALGGRSRDLPPGPNGSLRAGVFFAEDLPWLYLQEVPEPKGGKNRVHLDIGSKDIDADRLKLQELGATLVTVMEEVFGDRLTRWMIMRDPEGNEFCLVPEEAT